MKTFILGAGGHSRALISLLHVVGIFADGMYDDSFTVEEKILGVPVLGKLEAVPQDAQLYLAVGDVHRRADLYHRYQPQIVNENLVHPQAWIEQSAKIGQSNQFFAFAYCNAVVSIGNNNIINTKATLEHEVVIGNHNHIAVGATLCGRVTIGNNCFMGAGSTVIDGISIGDNVIIGAQAVVVENISEPGTYVGVPAKKIT